MAALCFALSFSACATDSDTEDGPKLNYDANYVAVFSPYTSPEDCIANAPDPRGCRFTITLCRNGRAAQRIADIVSSGTYAMTGGVAHATFTDGRTLEFDVDAQRDLGDPATTWIFDVNNLHSTLSFDTISCD